MIVDASVALKWHLKEPDSALAAGILVRGHLSAPSFLIIEAGHVLTKCVRQRLFSPQVAREVWLDLVNGPLELIDCEPLLGEALDLSLRLTANFYDCVYLALALATGDLVVTADERFRRAVGAAPELRDRVQTLSEAST